MLTYFFIFLAVRSATTIQHDYFWRDYVSEIPSDAIPGGTDINGNEIYIGQAYIHGHGVFVMQIEPRNSNRQVAAYGAKNPEEVQRILCSKHPENFKWLRTTAKTFHLDIIGKVPVVGGYDHVDANKGMLHVGRTSYEGGIKIGSVAGYQLENAQLSFIGGKREQKAGMYEVLLFETSDKITV